MPNVFPKGRQQWTQGPLQKSSIAKFSGTFAMAVNGMWITSKAVFCFAKQVGTGVNHVLRQLPRAGSQVKRRSMEQDQTAITRLKYISAGLQKNGFVSLTAQHNDDGRIRAPSITLKFQHVSNDWPGQGQCSVLYLSCVPIHMYLGVSGIFIDRALPHLGLFRDYFH